MMDHGNGAGLSILKQILMTAGGVLLVAFLGFTDYVTGYELSFSIFYLIPIFAVTWYAGKSHGIFIAVVAGATWLVSDLVSHPPYSNALIPYWNACVRFGFFVLTSLMLAAIRKSMEREKELSRTDSLTGADNARAFHEHAAIELDRSRRTRRPLSVAYLDCDNFKTVNDTLGHTVGDTLLCLVVETIKQHTRTYDMVARLGGDEFALLLPETSEPDAATLLNRISASLGEAMEYNQWPVTFSVGAVTFGIPPTSVNDMIKVADALMYDAKNNGKNQILHQVR